jgi:hypothetical protein
MLHRHIHRQRDTRCQPRRNTRWLRLEHLEDRAVPATINWTGGPTGTGTNWLDPTNWVGGVVPGSGDDAIIPTTIAPRQITLAGDAAAHSVNMGWCNLRINSGSLTIGAGQSNFTQGLGLMGGTLIPLDGASIDGAQIYGTGPFTIPDGVTLTLSRAQVTAPFANNGTLDVNGGGSTIGNTGGSVANASTINVLTGGTLSIYYSSLYAVSFSTTGTVTVAAGAVFQVPTGQYTQSSGTTTVDGTLTCSTLNLNGGVVAGTGSVGRIWSGAGTVSPGDANSPTGTLTLPNGYAQVGPNANLAIDLNGTGAGQYDQLKVIGDVILTGNLTVTAGYAAKSGDTFVVINNDGTDAISGPRFTGLPEGALLTVGEQQFRISYVGGDGNDVTLTRFVSAPPKVLATKVNDGSAQRSRVTSLTLTFDSPMTFAGAVGDAFTLTHDSDGAVVNITSATYGPNFVVQLAGFTGPATEYGSLAEGTYTLTALAGQISANGFALDGNGDGTGGDNYTFGNTQGLYRMFGDGNGDRHVDAADSVLFQQAYNSSAGSWQYAAGFDVNGDGVVDTTDMARFRQAYLTQAPRVTGAQVNDGSAQRSRVTSLQVTFSRTVSFAGPVASAFSLTRDGDGAAVLFTATTAVVNGATVITLSGFTGPATEYGSLADGTYTLTALAGKISASGLALDGNGDGATGDNYSFGSSQGLYRFFGDMNGDRVVDATDLAQFRQTFNLNAANPLYLAALDFNGDGVVDSTDLGAFRMRYNHWI